jgi:hypothetical protein
MGKATRKPTAKVPACGTADEIGPRGTLARKIVGRIRYADINETWAEQVVAVLKMLAKKW